MQVYAWMEFPLLIFGIWFLKCCILLPTNLKNPKRMCRETCCMTDHQENKLRTQLRLQFSTTILNIQLSIMIPQSWSLLNWLRCFYIFEDNEAVVLFCIRFETARFASFRFSSDDRRAAETARKVGTERFYLNFLSKSNKVTFQMIIEGRSPTMRHVSRTHRVALDWLFDRINLDLDQKIQIKNVDTKHNSQTYWQRAISHVMSGTIFSICVTSAISGQFAALRISALPAAQKRWRTGSNKDTEKRELWQSRSRRLNLVSKTEATSATVLSPNASNRPGILGAPCQYDWKSTRKL